MAGEANEDGYAYIGSMVFALSEDDWLFDSTPFYGMRHANSSLFSTSSNRWRFSAKEIQTTAGIGLLDFGARLYDDRTCRWTTQDPLATKYAAFSPYSYCAGDPVNLVDTDGNGPVAALAGLVIGGAIGGIIAVCEGKEGDELVGAIAGGAVAGATAGATDGLVFIPEVRFVAVVINKALIGESPQSSLEEAASFSSKQAVLGW